MRVSFEPSNYEEDGVFVEFVSDTGHAATIHVTREEAERLKSV